MKSTIHGYRNVAFYPGPRAEGYAHFFTSATDRDAALVELRQRAIQQGLSKGAAQAGIYPVTIKAKYLSQDDREELESLGSVEIS